MENRAVGAVLDSEWPEGTETETVARAAVKALWDLYNTSIRDTPEPLKPGLFFKTPGSGITHYVAWLEGEMAWIVTDKPGHGYLGNVRTPYWYWIAPAKVQAVTQERFTKNSEGIEVGDRIVFPKASMTFAVIAVSPHAILMRDLKSLGLYAESNTNLKEHYRRL